MSKRGYFRLGQVVPSSRPRMRLGGRATTGMGHAQLPIGGACLPLLPSTYGKVQYLIGPPPFNGVHKHCSQLLTVVALTSRKLLC